MIDEHKIRATVRKWVKNNTRPAMTGEKCLTWNDLWIMTHPSGCTIGQFKRLVSLDFELGKLPRLVLKEEEHDA